MDEYYYYGFGRPFKEPAPPGYIGSWGRTFAEAARDNTAVDTNFASPKKLWWEKPKPKYIRNTELEKPFVSELQKEAIKRQAEQEPQSGHVDPQLFPAMGVIKGAKQTGGFMKEDAKRKLREMLEK